MAGVRVNFRMKLCHEYCDKGSCEKERGKCKFWHICKGFLEGSCFGNCCRSHNFYDKDNKAKAKALGVEIFSNGTVRNAVAWSLPQVCQLYLRNECRSDNCPYLHVCSQAVKGPACDCILSHTLTDHHNNKVLQQYDMVPHDLVKPGFLCCNILVQIQKEQRIFHNRRCTCGGQATNEGQSQLGDSATTEFPSEKGLISPKHIAVDDLYDQGTHAISNVTNSEQKELEGAFKLQMESENKVRNPCKSKLNKRTKPTSEGLSDTSSPQPNTNSLERVKLIGSEGSDSCSNSSSNVQQECKARKESKNVKKCSRDSRTHHPPRKNSLHVDDRHAVRQQESKKSVSTCELNLKRKDEDEVKVLGFNKTSTSSKHHSLEEPKVAKRNPRTYKTITKCLERADKGDGPRGGELNRGIKVCNELASRNRKCLQKSGQEKCTMTREGCDCAIKGQVEKVQKDANSAHSPDKPNTKVSLPNDSKRGINGYKITTQIHDTAATDCIEEQKQDLVSAKANSDSKPLRAHLTSESVLQRNGPKRRSKGSKMTAQSLDTQTVSKSAKVNNEPNPLSAHLTNESDSKVLPGNDPKRKSKGSKMTAQIPDTESVSKSANVNNEPNLLNARLTNASDTKVLPGNDPKRKSKGSKMAAQILGIQTVSKSVKVNNEPNPLSAHLTNESDSKVLPGNDPKRKSKGSKMTAQNLDTESVSKSANVNNEPNLLNAHLTNESDTKVLPGNDPKRKSKGSKMTAQIPATRTVSKGAKANSESKPLIAHLTNESDTNRRPKSAKATAQILDTATAKLAEEQKKETKIAKAKPNHIQDENASKNSAQGSNRTKESARSAYKLGQTNNTSLVRNDSKRRKQSSKMITQISHTTAVRNVEELKQDLESANYKENHESKANHLQDETAAKKSVQETKMTKENLDRSAWKQKFDNEIENFPCNSLSGSAQKRLEISCDTSANNTPAKHNKTMKITEYLAPDGLMQDLAITEGAKTLVTDNSRDLQSLLPSKSMEAESYRELFDSNSCRPASLTRDVSLKMKVFECLCKEYDCSASFTVISKRRDLFPCGFKDIKSWFQKHGNRFLITADKQGIISEVNAYSSWARLCCNYNRVGECTRENCQYLHICKDYVTNSCSHGTFCPWNHHFQDERDKALLSRVGLDKLTDEQLRKLVLSSSPQVCVAYNKGICDRGNSCKRIHICCDHLKMTCRKECRYGLDHESAMNTGHTQSVLKRYHLDHLHSHLLKQIILVSDQSPKASKKDVPICSDFLLGICGKGFHCQAYHCPLPFYWQYRLTKDNEWKSFGEEDNEKLEKLYCDVTQNDCSATGFHISLERGESILLKEAHEVRFLLDRMVMVLEEESEIIADLRRLSTPSNVTDPGSSVAVHWIWYWKERDEIWREYGQDDRGRDLQRALEEAFLNSRNCFRFRLVGQEYTLSFAPTVQMSETSLKLGSVRTVRRRPARVISKNDIPNLKRSHILLPLSWRNKTRRVKMPRNRTAVPSDREFKRISLPPHSAEFREMAKVFSKSIKCSVVIINIEKVQVPFMWKKYQRRKGFKPGVKAGGSKRKLLTERQLVHGTRTAEKKSWKQNLDWCSACKYVCTFSREEHQRIRRRKLLRLDFLPQE